LYIPKDLSARASAARGTHALHMFTARVASEPGGTKCATARKRWCAASNVFTFTPAQAPWSLPTSLNFAPGAETKTANLTRPCERAVKPRLGCSALHRRLGAPQLLSEPLLQARVGLHPPVALGHVGVVAALGIAVEAALARVVLRDGDHHKLARELLQKALLLDFSRLSHPAKGLSDAVAKMGKGPVRCSSMKVFQRSWRRVGSVR
jgi:hypothetical protein